MAKIPRGEAEWDAYLQEQEIHTPLPEEIEEIWRCYYQEVYMQGEDEEMFTRDMMAGNLPL